MGCETASGMSHSAGHVVQAALLEALAAVLLHLEDVSDSTLQQCVALIDRLAGEGHDMRADVASCHVPYTTWQSRLVCHLTGTPHCC